MERPVGWFVVGYGDELPARGVEPLRYFGEPLLMFRTADGQPMVLGAHHWFFDGIPYNRKVPRTVVRNWPVCERNGLILVYVDPAGADPKREIPHLPEHGSDDWTRYATRRFIVRTDAQRMMESTLASHGHSQDPLGGDGGIDTELRLRTRTEMATPFGPVPGTLDIQSHGLGLSIVRFTGAVETLLIATVTPIDEELVDARFAFSVKKLPDESATRRLEQGFLDELTRQIESDTGVREHGARARSAGEPRAAAHSRAQHHHV